MMQNTQQWLDKVKSNQVELNHWLERQYVGEQLAANRIEKLAIQQEDNRYGKVLQRIANDERKHAEWVRELLVTRNIDIPVLSMDGTRYWSPILSKITSFEEVAAVGHHAEAMRLIRIKALAADTEIDSDIRDVFTKILPDEEFHTKAFAAMTDDETIEKTRDWHEEGLQVLGLEI